MSELRKEEESGVILVFSGLEASSLVKKGVKVSFPLIPYLIREFCGSLDDEASPRVGKFDFGSM